MVPSPKSQRYETIALSGSVDEDALNVNRTPGYANAGFMRNDAVGGAFTRTSPNAVCEAPRSSVTVRATVYVPGRA